MVCSLEQLLKYGSISIDRAVKIYNIQQNNKIIQTFRKVGFDGVIQAMKNAIERKQIDKKKDEKTQEPVSRNYHKK